MEPTFRIALIVVALLSLGRDARRTEARETGPQHTNSIDAQQWALTPEQWAGRANAGCVRANNTRASNIKFKLPFMNLWSNLMDEKCHRDAASWRFQYADELMPAFRLRVLNRTMDERLVEIANSLYVTNMFDTSHTYFDSGDHLRDSINTALVAGPEVDEDNCTRDLRLMTHQLDDLGARLGQLRAGPIQTQGEMVLAEQHIRLARVLDSFGRYESGALDGKTRFTGDYVQCESSQLLATATDGNDNEDALVPMRYCWANLKSSRDLHAQLRQRKRYAHETAPGLLSAGICLPRSCHSKHFRHNRQQHREHRQLVQKLLDAHVRPPESIYVRPNYELESVFCLVDETSEYARIPSSGRLCLMFIAAWVSMCIVVTILNGRQAEDSAKGKSAARTTIFQRLRQHLDMAQSWRDFTSDKRQVTPQQRVNLDALNPVKFGASILCICFHSQFIMLSMSASLLQVMALIDSTAFNQGTAMTSVVIDTFFVLSGLLATYISLNKVAQYHARREEHQSREMVVRESRVRSLAAISGQIALLAANRYLRIVPLYALMFWFRRDVLTYLGAGPFWDYGLNKNTMNGACLREPWYSPLSAWATFEWPTRQCFMTAWSVGLDIIFGVLMLPPVILLLRRYPKLTVSSLVALMVASLLASLEAFSSVEPAGVRWEMFDARISGLSALFTSFNYLYAWPIYRLPSFVIGVLAGYYLHVYSTKQQLKEEPRSSCSSSNWPSWLTGPATWMAIGYIILHGLVSLACYQIKLAIFPYHRLLILYTFTLDRAVWSAANALIFLRMVTDWRLSSPMLWCSSQTWRSLAKLSYPIVFVHWLLMIAFLGWQLASPILTIWNVFSLFSALSLATLPISLLVHVFFESPMEKLVKREILMS